MAKEEEIYSIFDLQEIGVLKKPDLDHLSNTL